MVCLNLPPELRYKLENMLLVAIVPGPKAPSLTQLNHFLRPLMTQLRTFFHRGYFFSWTPSREQGRLSRGAFIPLVADLHAIRQVGAFGSYSSRHFCTFCGLFVQDIEEINPDYWPRLRTCAQHRQYATEWLNAESQDKRNHLFELNGIRWSELLTLDYWDPCAFTLYDVMHGWYLNVADDYVRDILG
ncbi:hypothetical protein M422DRAFT_84157, partial [Sphaerobolus stellatus SS14]